MGEDRNHCRKPLLSLKGKEALLGLLVHQYTVGSGRVISENIKTLLGCDFLFFYKPQQILLAGVIGDTGAVQVLDYGIGDMDGAALCGMDLLFGNRDFAQKHCLLRGIVVLLTVQIRPDGIGETKGEVQVIDSANTPDSSFPTVIFFDGILCTSDLGLDFGDLRVEISQLLGNGGQCFVNGVDLFLRISAGCFRLHSASIDFSLDFVQVFCCVRAVNSSEKIDPQVRDFLVGVLLYACQLACQLIVGSSCMPCGVLRMVSVDFQCGAPAGNVRLLFPAGRKSGLFDRQCFSDRTSGRIFQRIELYTSAIALLPACDLCLKHGNLAVRGLQFFIISGALLNGALQFCILKLGFQMLLFGSGDF